MDFRTDLAIERNEILEKSDKDIQVKSYSKSNINITEIRVKNDKGAKKIQKPVGRYITAELPPFADDTEIFDGRLDILADELNSLLPDDGTVLIAGLGNENITPDALGPRCVDFVLATRHIGEEIASSIGFKNLRPVAGIAPGVLGQTGIETGEIISGIVNSIKPSAVITVDALASRNLNRLGCTVQITDTGIVPGSGVGNARKEISEKTLGVKVISIGVPTVVDGNTLVSDLSNGKPISDEGKNVIVTPREIDLMIERASRLIGMMINHALQPEINCEDILSLVT